MTQNKTVLAWLEEMKAMTKPDEVIWIDGSEEQLEALTRYANAFGLLFQATDDLLDVVGTEAEMGKTLGKDAASGKLTCIAAYGVEGTRRMVERLHAEAVTAMQMFGEKSCFFTDLVDSMVGRTH